MKSFIEKNKFLSLLAGWILLSLMQSAFTGLNEDEAYYWMWSKQLDWGYFDHPPAVALQIAIGQIFGDYKLTLRLMTAFLNAGAIYFLWKIVSEYTRDAKFFWFAAASFPLVHIYAFITTPDASLFFFATGFFYFYKKYCEEDNWQNTIITAFFIAMMFYSKYHAVLLVGFTVLSNFKLLTRKSFWFIVIGTLLLLTPHILWQIENDYPSIRYQLFERSKSAYRYDFTTAYLLNQFLVLGPLTAYFLIKSAWKTKANSDFERALKWNFYGILIFFFMSSFKGWVEPHWTYVAVIPISILGIKGLSENQKFRERFMKFALPSLILLFVVRIMLIVPGPWSEIRALKRYYNGEKWANQLSEQAGAHPLIFRNGFQEPSLYAFYSGGNPVFVQTDIGYRKHQYDLWNFEENLFGQTVVFAEKHKVPESTKHVTPWSDIYIKTTNNYFGVGKLDVRIDEPEEHYEAGATKVLNLTIKNGYNVPLELSKTQNNEVSLLASFRKYKNISSDIKNEKLIPEMSLEPGESFSITLPVQFPENPGKYQLIIGAKTNNSPVRNNGRSIEVTVK